MRAMFLLIASGLAIVQAGCNGSGELGRFNGEVQTQWLDDGRTMKLLADFSYFDPAGNEWDAPSGSMVDGASIPQVFWSLIGGPFEGQYRNASIVHDVACRNKNKDWRQVHKMFYNACRCGGVSELEAKLLYSAVYHFGPRWGGDLETDTVLSSEDDFQRLQMMITIDPNVDTAEIERQTPMTLKRRVPKLPEPIHPEIIVTSRFRRALDATGSGGVRLTGDQRSVEFIATDEGQLRRIQEQLPGLRAAAASDVNEEVGKLRAQISREPDRDRRAILASRLVTLTRERAALSRAEMRVKVVPE